MPSLTIAIQPRSQDYTDVSPSLSSRLAKHSNSYIVTTCSPISVGSPTLRKRLRMSCRILPLKGGTLLKAVSRRRGVVMGPLLFPE